MQSTREAIKYIPQDTAGYRRTLYSRMIQSLQFPYTNTTTVTKRT